ncbi:hypothetical protein HMPREF1979_02959 [Actinomyces johnsonii F0542]|uniref:Uncharacterized protein n=1 Tax=Actinomyces johnsonii F0542 TaxID=1321818 RepID=U1RQV6_9ACTO|nr:hypothetical protein HMPREF1979_02959 [Actinomyces johnsonii F0542]
MFRGRCAGGFHLPAHRLSPVASSRTLASMITGCLRHWIDRVVQEYWRYR